MPFWCLIFCIGVVVQMAVQDGQWVGIAMGRWVAGLGVGALSVLTPLYVSESTPKQVRGAAVCSYQLFITIGILIADVINYGTEGITNTGSYRIPMGIGFLWAIILAGGMLMMPESPRWDIRKGNHERAFQTMTKFYGVSQNHRVVDVETKEINAALEAASGDHPWYEAITGPRMFYRVALGMTMQMWQQLTGANFFFYCKLLYSMNESLLLTRRPRWYFCLCWCWNSELLHNCLHSWCSQCSLHCMLAPLS